MPSCLVIDENNIVQKVASRILSGIHFDTVGVSGMQEAEGLLSMTKTSFDLVLLSSTLPGTPVDVALRSLRGSPDDPRQARRRQRLHLSPLRPRQPDRLGRAFPRRGLRRSTGLRSADSPAF